MARLSGRPDHFNFMVEPPAGRAVRMLPEREIIINLDLIQNP